MGASADATIAWGVVLTVDHDDVDYEDTAACDAADEYDERIGELGKSDLDPILGFTEERPGWDDEAAAEAWRARRAEANPLDVEFYGDLVHGESGNVLIIVRTESNVNYGCEAIDPAKLTPPTESELAKINAVLDAIGYKGDREPKLFLFACYG